MNIFNEETSIPGVIILTIGMMILLAIDPFIAVGTTMVLGGALICLFL